jgi:hypothetical protein
MFHFLTSIDVIETDIQFTSGTDQFCKISILI